MTSAAAGGGPTTYVLVNQLCGHVLGCANDRQMLLSVKSRIVIHGFKGWVVEERPITEEEAGQLIDAERCATCTLDGNLRKMLR